MGTEVVFKATFKRNLSEEEITDFCSQFINHVEQQQLYFGGGFQKDHFGGGVYTYENKHSYESVKKILEDFIENKNVIISQLIIL